MGRTYFFYGLELELWEPPKVRKSPKLLKLRRQPKDRLSSIRIFKNTKREDIQRDREERERIASIVST